MSNNESASAPTWLIYLVLVVLGMQVLTTLATVIGGAAVIGRYAERLDETKRLSQDSAKELSGIRASLERLGPAVDRLTDYWNVDTRKIFGELDKLKGDDSEPEKRPTVEK